MKWFILSITNSIECHSLLSKDQQYGENLVAQMHSHHINNWDNPHRVNQMLTQHLVEKFLHFDQHPQIQYYDLS
jgi:hypothetical protein